MKFGRFCDDDFLDFDHKTVIVLDHSPKFARLAGQALNLALKDPLTGQMRVPCSVKKSLWSYAVESSLELHRIVDEIYPDGSRLMRFVISDFVGRFLNFEWKSSLVDSEQLVKLFSKCGMPNSKADSSSCSIINGISMAVEALSELTELQKKSVVLRHGGDGLLRSDLFSAAISNMRYEILSEKERILSSTQARLCKKHMIRHDANSLKREKAQDDVVKGKLLYYAKSVKNFSMADEGTVSCNKGSIIIFTSLESEKDVATIENQVFEEIINRNKVVSVLDIEGEDRNFAPITHVNLYIINLQTSEVASGKGVCPKLLNQINDYLSSSVICAEVGPSLPLIVRGIAVNHYGLASTTVTGIPMKEEAQQGQSVNYDVEILHLRKAHSILEERGLIGPNSILRSPLSPGGYDTIKLAWCTSSLKSQCIKYSRCLSASTVSPANVNSRPSVCLTSFLLSNHNVMLEIPSEVIPDYSSDCLNDNQKVLSHLLMCHAGRIYIHTMWLGDHPILDNNEMHEDSILPKVDARQLRSSDFVNLARDCQLTYDSAMSESRPSTSGEVYNEEARKRLKRFTRYWPVMLSDAFIYNIPSRFEPLLSLVRKDELSVSDMNKCRECICALVAFRDSKEPLTMKTFDCKKLKKLQNREDQLKVAMREVLLHLRNYVNNSEKHLELYNMFAQICGLDRSGSLSVSDVILSDSGEICTPSTSFEKSRVQSASDSCLKGSSDAPSRSPSADSLRSQSRSNSPFSKRARKERKWPPDEMKARDYFYDELQKQRWSRWIDCIGRLKNVPLYGNHEFNDDQKSADLKGA